MPAYHFYMFIFFFFLPKSDPFICFVLLLLTGAVQRLFNVLVYLRLKSEESRAERLCKP